MIPTTRNNEEAMAQNELDRELEYSDPPEPLQSDYSDFQAETDKYTEACQTLVKTLENALKTLQENLENCNKKLEQLNKML